VNVVVTYGTELPNWSTNVGALARFTVLTWSAIVLVIARAFALTVCVSVPVLVTVTFESLGVLPAGPVTCS
jgi:hypothetical protein